MKSTPYKSVDFFYNGMIIIVLKYAKKVLLNAIVRGIILVYRNLAGPCSLRCEENMLFRLTNNSIFVKI